MKVSLYMKINKTKVCSMLAFLSGTIVRCCELNVNCVLIMTALTCLMFNRLVTVFMTTLSRVNVFSFCCLGLFKHSYYIAGIKELFGL